MILKPGLVIEQYRIESRLGAGGMAEVWQVRHETLHTAQALKVLTRATPALTRRLLREGRAQATLRHDNLLPVHDVLDVFGRPGLLMPLVEGPSLSALLEQAPPTPAEARDLLLGITAGLRYAHAAGFVHRDLKPANVLLDLRGDRVVPRVADFGLVKAHDALRTQAGMVMGTPAYAAPEQLRDAAGAGTPADIFSLGALLVELLTGHLPFPGDSLPAIRQSHEQPPRLDGLSPPMADLARALLQVDPAQRLSSCDDIRLRLGDHAARRRRAGARARGGPRRRHPLDRHRLRARLPASRARGGSRGSRLASGRDRRADRPSGPSGASSRSARRDGRDTRRRPRGWRHPAPARRAAGRDRAPSRC